MTLTFTCSISVAQDGNSDVRTMLFAALGCNIAWGIIDGVFYVFASVAERTRNYNTLVTLRETVDPGLARNLIVDSLPPVIGSVMKTEEIETVRRRLLELPEPPKTTGLRRTDIVGFLTIFALVVSVTFPVVIPFLVFPKVILALRLSNAVAVAMLFATGARLGKASGRLRLRNGTIFVIIGVVMVGICVALGG